MNDGREDIRRAAEELAARVGPLVAFGAGDIERPRGDQRQQEVGVERHLVFAVVVLLEISAEPVWERSIEVDGALAEVATADGGAAFAVDLASMAHETQYTRLFRT